MLNQDTAKLLKGYRKERSLTQEELSFRSDVPVRTIQDLEAGKCTPRLETIFKLSVGFDLDHRIFTQAVFEVWQNNQDDE